MEKIMQVYRWDKTGANARKLVEHDRKHPMACVVFTTDETALLNMARQQLKLI